MLKEILVFVIPWTVFTGVMAGHAFWQEEIQPKLKGR